MELNVIAIDIAKKVFQLHWVEADTGSIERLKLKRSQMLEWFAAKPPALIAMEACGGAHEWGRELVKLGHEVRLLPPKMVRPFVQRNKTDAADAQAIWTAARQPGVRFVALKSEAQQVVLALHRMRAQLMKTRIMQTNELRGLLYEFGIVLSEGHQALMKELPAALEKAQQRLPSMLVDSLHEQVRRIGQLQADIGAIELRLPPKSEVLGLVENTDKESRDVKAAGACAVHAGVQVGGGAPGTVGAGYCGRGKGAGHTQRQSGQLGTPVGQGRA
jgi:transposase